MDGEENKECENADVQNREMTEHENEVVMSEHHSEENEEGLRMFELRRALNKAIEKCLSGLKYKAFAEGYPAIAKAHRSELQSHHRQYVEQLRTLMMSEVESVFEEEQVVERLRNLDAVLVQTQTRLAWRPATDPRMNIKAHMLPVFEQQRDRLQQIAREAEKENGRLQQRVEKQRTEHRNTVAEVNKLCDILTLAASEVSADEVNAFLNKTKLGNTL